MNIKDIDNDYEEVSYGPITIIRNGRYVYFKSDFTPESFKKYREGLKDNRIVLKKKISTTINKLLKLTEKFDPLFFLMSISIKNIFGNPELYKEATHEGKECYVEYAQSLILSQDRKNNSIKPPGCKIKYFEKNIQELFQNILYYYTFENVEEKYNKVDSELRFLSLIKYIFVRGDSIIEHHLEMVKDIFSDHDIFLKNNFGMDIDQILEAINEVELQLNNNMEDEIKPLLLYMELRDNKLKKGITDQNKIEEMMQLQEKVKENSFEITPNNKVPVEFLKLLSCSYGDNSQFLKFEKSPAWPTNDSIIFEKPILKNNDTFYCFLPTVLFRNIDYILEVLIKNQDNSYFQNIYTKKRAKYLERKSLEYFKNIFPKADIFGELFYWVIENGIKTKVSSDGLILYDDNIFLIEAKAGSMSLAAKRGSLEKIKVQAKKLIEEAYIQALRTRDYIINMPEPKFEYENSLEAVTIQDKEKYKNIFLINITLQNLSQFSTKLNSLRKIGLIEGKEWPWSVYINDLRIISELIESPSIFLYFLKQRIKANDNPQFYATEELDFLMYFFKEGLFFENNKSNKVKVVPTGYTQEIDRYYDYKAGRVTSGKKPYLEINEDFKKLITEIENTGKSGFTDVTTTLLFFDKETMDEVIKSIIVIKENSEKDGRDHNFTMTFNDEKMGFTVLNIANSGDLSIGEIDNHYSSVMKSNGYEKWILIFLFSLRKEIDFKIYYKSSLDS